MMRWWIFFCVLPLNVAMATPDLECALSESRSGIDFELALRMDLSQRVGGTIPFTTPGSRVPGSVSVLPAELGKISLLDPSTNAPTHVTFFAAPGAASRLLLMGSNTDSIQMDCARAGELVAKPAPARLACEMMEGIGDAQVPTKFDVPVSSSGHDVQDLPPAMLAGTAGWVLGYNGIIVIFFRNQTTYSGITAMGSWDGVVSASWSPQANIRVKVTCQGAAAQP